MNLANYIFDSVMSEKIYRFKVKYNNFIIKKTLYLCFEFKNLDLML